MPITYFFCSRCHEPLEDADTYCTAHADAQVVLIVVSHLHTCPECLDRWTCEDADCEPQEQERLCNYCQQAYLR